MQQQTQQQLIQGVTHIVDNIEHLESELFIRDIKSNRVREVIDQGVSLLSIINDAPNIDTLHMIACSLYIQASNEIVIGCMQLKEITPNFNFINCDEDTCTDCGTSLVTKSEERGEVDYCNGCGATYTL